MQIKSAIFLQRYNTAAIWSENNPILKAGELGIESDTGRVKAGDGISTWNELDYAIDNNEEQSYTVGRGLVVDNSNTLSAAIQYKVLREYYE